MGKGGGGRTALSGARLLRIQLLLLPDRNEHRRAHYDTTELVLARGSLLPGDNWQSSPC